LTGVKEKRRSSSGKREIASGRSSNSAERGKDTFNGNVFQGGSLEEKGGPSSKRNTCREVERQQNKKTGKA